MKFVKQLIKPLIVGAGGILGKTGLDLYEKRKQRKLEEQALNEQNQIIENQNAEEQKLYEEQQRRRKARIDMMRRNYNVLNSRFSDLI